MEFSFLPLLLFFLRSSFNNINQDFNKYSCDYYYYKIWNKSPSAIFTLININHNIFFITLILFIIILNSISGSRILIIRYSIIRIDSAASISYYYTSIFFRKVSGYPCKRSIPVYSTFVYRPGFYICLLYTSPSPRDCS